MIKRNHFGNLSNMFCVLCMIFSVVLPNLPAHAELPESKKKIASADAVIKNESKGNLRASTNVLEDIPMSLLKDNKIPKSDWIESEKTMYRDLLKKYSYDLLIVPFQVQGYAIDRVGRSLMTRYLHNRIALSHAKVPNMTMVSRALGDNSRTLDENEIYQLANDLGVRVLIKGYVGHNRDEKLLITILVQTREGNSAFSPETKTIALHWEGISFSDENPPSAVFLSHLEEIVSKLPLDKSVKLNTTFYEKIAQIPVPKTISEMDAESNQPMIKAYYLQLLGMFFPEQTTAKENLFERSLVALTNVSPQSPDYNLLKARAYFYLHRRPAALTALGKASTEEEKALLSLLNGNLPDLQKWSDKIKSPLQKLISQIELNDLLRSYKKPVSHEDCLRIARLFPEWEMIVTRRLEHTDEWASQSNLEVKHQLDKVFPLPGFTAENLATSRLVLEEASGGEETADFSVYSHCRRLLSAEWQRFGISGDEQSVSELDYLSLLYAISESNLLKEIRLIIFIQSLPDAALKKLDIYDPIYRGHPEMTYLRAEALRRLTERKQGYVHANLKQRTEEEAHKAFFWSQGQNETSYKSSFFLKQVPKSPLLLLYNADYPRRWYWFPMQEGDRKVLKKTRSVTNLIDIPEDFTDIYRDRVLALMYTHNDFDTFLKFYSELEYMNQKKLADNLLDLNRHRFIGAPARSIFMIAHKDEQNENTDKKKLYEEAILASPDVWQSYKNLGMSYIREGDFKNALATFQKYPLIRDRNNNDPIMMSKYAVHAAIELFWVGAIDEATVLYKVSAESNTGSAAEMLSLETLALLNHNYAKAASHCLDLMNRYNYTYAYRDYISLLHVMGHHREAWAFFNTVDINSYSPQIWTAAFIGLSMEQWTDAEISRFLTQDNVIKSENRDRGHFLLMAQLIDKRESKGFSSIVNEMKWNQGDQSIPDLAAYKLQLIDFADGYFAMKEGNYHKAYELFKKDNYFKNDLALNQCILPYVFRAGAKIGKLTEFDNNLKAAQYENDSFDIHLSQAFLLGSAKKHSDAIAQLKLASYRIPSTGSRPIFGWYQLVEACEWLYKDSGIKEYRDLALQWAKLHQRIQPMFAWAYAVEAKYTETDSDRTRALALALYLDKGSEHITYFSDAEKERAIGWLKENNPFIEKEKASM
jgi:hypothetical protein